MNQVPQSEFRIVSGGQTGVDRAALDAAIAAGIQHGGWCPRGRRAEDGPIPHTYALQETDARDYRVRTEKNVVDSDATLILYHGELSGGTLLTQQLAQQHGRRILVVKLPAPVEPVANWLHETKIRCLNVAGPRASSWAKKYDVAYDFMLRLLNSWP